MRRQRRRKAYCSSAPAKPNLAACLWQCAIRSRASIRNGRARFRPPSTPRSPPAWAWGCRSAVRSSTRMAADRGRAKTCPAAPSFSSPCRAIQPLHRDWHAPLENSGTARACGSAALAGRMVRTGIAGACMDGGYFTGVRIGAPFFLSRNTTNFAGCVLLALRPTVWISLGRSWKVSPALSVTSLPPLTPMTMLPAST